MRLRKMIKFINILTGVLLISVILLFIIFNEDEKISVQNLFRMRLKGYRKTVTSSDKELEIRIQGPVKDDDFELLHHLRKILVPPSGQPYNLSTNQMDKSTSRIYGWLSIHKLIKYLFSDTEYGFFVEAGALDGEYLSNSLWLEKKLHWSGLLVEPEVINYKELVFKRRKAWLSFSCLSSEKFPKREVLVSVRRKVNILSSSLIIRGSSFLQRYVSVMETGGFSQFFKGTYFTYFSSQCYPLYSYLLALNVTVVDFLSLDMQGAEVDVFKTIPLDKIYIRSLVVEVSEAKTNYKLIKYFNELGFNLMAITISGPDYFFVNRKDVKLTEKLKQYELSTVS